MILGSNTRLYRRSFDSCTRGMKAAPRLLQAATDSNQRGVERNKDGFAFAVALTLPQAPNIVVVMILHPMTAVGWGQ